MKTLMATDGSSAATTALVSAGRLLTRSGNRFDLICIVPEFHKKKGRFHMDYYHYMERNSSRVLKKATEILQAQGIEARVLGKTGSPGDVLTGIGEDYDVVVVGAQSRLERPSPGLGPVASRIVEHASGIALVGRELANESSFKILAAVDGSAMSRNAIDALIANFNLDDAQVTLMHVLEKPWLQLGVEEDWHDLERAYAPEDPEPTRILGSELRLEADQIIEDARRLLERVQTVSTEARIEEGIPASLLLHEAETGNYDLIVVGATGVSDLKHTMLGSVAFKLASYAPCSVAVVR
jgi:nucleotide-binding universal stress UspA family protein